MASVRYVLFCDGSVDARRHFAGWSAQIYISRQDARRRFLEPITHVLDSHAAGRRKVTPAMAELASLYSALKAIPELLHNSNHTAAYLDVYNDNLLAVEHSVCIDDSALVELGAFHLAPLCHLVHDISVVLQQARHTVTIRRPPRGRNTPLICNEADVHARIQRTDRQFMATGGSYIDDELRVALDGASSIIEGYLPSQQQLLCHAF